MNPLPLKSRLGLLALFIASSLATEVSAQDDVERGLTRQVEGGKACVRALGESREKTYRGGYLLPASMQLISWNIYKAKRDELLPELTQYSERVDMLLLQEAVADTRLTELKPYWRFSPGYVDGDTPTGVMVLSRWPATVHCHFTHTEPWLRTPKATSVVEYALGSGERLLVLNLHSINFEWGVDSYRQQLQAAVDIMNGHTGPIIFAGDLNSWSDERRELMDLQLQPLGLTPTEFEQDNRTRTFGMALDHVWTRGVDIAMARVPRTESSDHNPLLIHLQLESSGQPLVAERDTL